MTHTVCQPCWDCKYTDCVVVCPVECFWQDEKMLYIDPQDCIDCEACVPECPVEAIFRQEDVPSQWTSYIQLNADRWPGWPRRCDSARPTGPRSPSRPCP